MNKVVKHVCLICKQPFTKATDFMRHRNEKHSQYNVSDNKNEEVYGE